MAEITNWVKKIWKNRTTEFPTRRTLMKEDGSSEIVTVTRNEGTVSEEGDAFDADTMNNLEERIDAGFAEVNGKLNKFVTENVELGSDVILSKNSNFTITFNVTKTGYIPMVVCSWALYNRDEAQYTHVNGIEVGTGINTGYVYIHGRYSNSSATGRIPANAYVGVLYQAQ